MSTRAEPWAQGTPNWVDLGSPDPAASTAFYGSLFGWEIHDSGPEMGHYGLCLLGGRRVAGIGPQPGGGDGPPAWLTYLAVDDLEKVAEAVPGAGGTVIAAPTTVGEAGRMAVVEDPTGAVVGLWQAGETIGFERYNEAGAVVWNEHMSRDPHRARDFYGSVFGYAFSQVEGHPYWTLSLEEGLDAVGGLGETSGDGPGRWVTYFMVDSVDTTAARAAQLGARVTQAPADTPFGRIAGIVDPQGAAFTLMSAPGDDGFDDADE